MPSHDTAPFQVTSVKKFVSTAPDCAVCQAGILLGFHWEGTSEDLPAHNAFVSPENLRRGTLYFCKACHRPWYLNHGKEMMEAVPEARLSLIREWNQSSINLPHNLTAKLEKIGRTPPDVYGNGQQYNETPCGVVTISGERIELAIVSIQKHAPFEEWRNYRLGSEIADIYPSPFALPLPVRIATSEAQEMRMGFSPTLIEMPDGKKFVLSARPNFMVKVGYNSGDATVSQHDLNFSKLPEILKAPENITYFVADA